MKKITYIFVIVLVIALFKNIYGIQNKDVLAKYSYTKNYNSSINNVNKNKVEYVINDDLITITKENIESGYTGIILVEGNKDTYEWVQTLITNVQNIRCYYFDISETSENKISLESILEVKPYEITEDTVIYLIDVEGKNIEEVSVEDGQVDITDMDKGYIVIGEKNKSKEVKESPNQTKEKKNIQTVVLVTAGATIGVPTASIVFRKVSLNGKKK